MAAAPFDAPSALRRADDGSASTMTLPARRVDGGRACAAAEQLAVEAPLQISVNGRPFVVTMRTPGRDEDLARGLLFSEGVLSDADACPAFYDEPVRSGNGAVRGARTLAVQVDEALLRWPDGGRSLAAGSSCGLCGKETLDDMAFAGAPVERRGRVPLDAVAALQERMRASQEAFARCGGTHAAAAFDGAGTLLAAAEDVGRHNAVDKVLGALLRTRRLPEAQALTVSGRVSYEIVAKAAAGGIGVLIAVSAPSSLAVELADARGIALIGFCRDERFTIYTHADALDGPTEDA